MWEEKGCEKEMGSKENPSKIERHVTQQRESSRFIGTKGEEAKGEREGERVRAREKRECMNKAKGETKMHLRDTPLNFGVKELQGLNWGDHFGGKC